MGKEEKPWCACLRALSDLRARRAKGRVWFMRASKKFITFSMYEPLPVSTLMETRQAGTRLGS